MTRGNRYGLPDRMNLVVGKITTNPRGFGFVVPDRPLEQVDGDIYVAGSNLNQAMHGDRVVVRSERITDRGAEGRIVRILQRGSQNAVGGSTWTSPGWASSCRSTAADHGRADSPRREQGRRARRHGHR